MKKMLYMAILLFLISTNSSSSSTKLGSATASIETFVRSVELFKLDVGRYPTTDEGLEALLKSASIEGMRTDGYIKFLRKDPWGNPFQYRHPGTHNINGFDIWSNGADGAVGGKEFNGDIGNWPDASKEHKAAYSAARRKKVLNDLPLAILIGVVFSGSIYMGISLIRLSDDIPGKRSFTGKSIWIALVFFIIYWLLAIPLLMQL